MILEGVVCQCMIGHLLVLSIGFLLSASDWCISAKEHSLEKSLGMCTEEVVRKGI